MVRYTLNRRRAILLSLIKGIDMRLFSVGVLGLALSGTAMAEDTSRNDELVTSVNLETIRFVAESLDHSVRRDLDDVIGILSDYTTADGGTTLAYALQGKACEESADCLGLEAMVIFDGNFDASKANSINQRWSAIKATEMEGKLYLSRYLILDNGQTIGNLRTNLLNTLAIAEQVDEEERNAAEQATTSETGATNLDIDFGADEGNYALDGACDDARFHEDGDDWNYQRSHVLQDATDCRDLYTSGEITLYLDFGDNSGDYVNDDTCDDNRFTGEGRSILQTDSQVKRDADDCIAAYRAGTINRP